MNLNWNDLDELMKDPDFRKRNGQVLASALRTGSQADVDMARRGRKNRASGQRFEEALKGVMDFLWVHGEGMVFNTGPAVVHVGKGQIKFKPQGRGKFTAPLNPPDFMGVLFGLPVAFDAKVSHSSATYYATRDKKAKQHEGIVDMARQLGIDALVGYVIEWEPKKISFIHALDCVDGKVRQSLACIESDTVEGVFRTWATQNKKNWPGG